VTWISRIASVRTCVAAAESPTSRREQLGIRAGLHRTEIGLLERGARVPRIDTLLKLAAALDIAVSDLLEGISWEPGEAQPGRFKLAS